jgi:thioredoxin reductase
VEIVEERVVDASSGFALQLAGGRTVEARHVLLATGAVDELPDVLGASERWDAISFIRSQGVQDAAGAARRRPAVQDGRRTRTAAATTG